MSNMLLQNIAMTLCEQASLRRRGEGLFFVPFARLSCRICSARRRAVLSGNERSVRLYSGTLRHASGRAAAVRRIRMMPYK